MSKVAGSQLLVVLLLAGCTTAPLSAEESTPPDAPVPAPIQHTVSDAEVQGAITTWADCGTPARACFAYPFSVDVPLHASIRLHWTAPDGRMSLQLLGPDGEIAWRSTPNGPDAGSLVIERSLSAAQYRVRVQATTGFTLDITFAPLRTPSAVLAEPPTYGPHVIIGIPDTGINPYHELYYRPHLTEHPCTYIRDFPCDVKELRLSVGMADHASAIAADQHVWANVERDTWYWIPQTVFVAVHCQKDVVPADPTFGSVFGDVCILDEGESAWNGHGTGTTSIALMQNPDAYLAFTESAQIKQFYDGAIPVDVVSVSWGSGVPFPYPAAQSVLPCPSIKTAPLFVKAAGNDGRLVPTDCQTAAPHVIAVGGGYTAPRAHATLSANMADVEGYWSPPWASRDSVTDVHPPGSWGGTSFATPTVAGALSKTILEVRRASGYDGALTGDGTVDPVRGITVSDLRDAMNRTASYTPAPKHPYTNTLMQVPLNTAAPWLQWGWGFYDSDVANATIGHLLGTSIAPDKPAEVQRHMETVYLLRNILYG